jgi:hypothetical protein
MLAFSIFSGIKKLGMVLTFGMLSEKYQNKKFEIQISEYK